MRANICCQISLALNRVYTEWYLSKGYSFQITNSTAYDQYYVHGRNIFDNISRLVDEMFAVYIRKSGTVNPFYAEYCDGRTVSCPGLKQWGTVALAGQGYTAFGMLKYYYGSDIELVTTTDLAAIPQSYPGSPLKTGSSGAAVRTVQRQLNRIARNYPSFGTLTVDGVFGPGTAEVVRRFQKQFSLTQDGIVGYSTWYKISYIYVAVKKLAELSSEGEYPNGDTVSDGSGAWPGTLLTVGSTGPAVRQVQYWLNTVRGYISGLALLKVDGSFGAATAAAVRIFQGWAGLAQDGIVGYSTWTALYKEFVSVMLEEDGELGYVTQYPGAALSTGSSGAAVRSVQFWLSVAAQNYGAVPEVEADGVYGTRTAAAVGAFQRLFGLSVDGVTGPLTWAKLREIFVDVALSLVPQNALPGTYPGSPLAAGSTGTAVRELQYYLFVLSHYYTGLPTLAYDGVYGSGTAAAVRAFQTLFGLEADGVAGPATWSAVYAAYIRLITVEGAARGAAAPQLYVPLGEGSEGAGVAYVQRLLEFLSLFFKTVQSPLSPTVGLPAEPGAFDAAGVFGPYTTAAVRSFQHQFMLAEDGVVGADTLARLFAAADSCSAQDVYGEAGSAANPDAVLQSGARGPLVAWLQSGLNAAAGRRPELQYTAEDGVFGEKTAAAVCALQRALGLPVTGSVTGETRLALQRLARCPCLEGTGWERAGDSPDIPQPSGD